MAVRTLPRWDRVRTCEREGRRVVVEGGIGPDEGVMTQLALGGEASCRVRRIGCARVIFLVTRVTGGAVQVVIVVQVAVGALPRRHGVRSGQREAGAVVVESSIEPCRCVVAGIAGLRKARGNVTWIGCSLIVH